MSKMTITEALQEIKTISARIAKKQENIGKYLVRDSRVRDPFEKDGGMDKFVREERQSLADLEKRQVKIRVTIQRANLDNTITLGEATQSVAEWLAWRREISKGRKDFLSKLASTIQGIRAQIQQKGGTVVQAAISQQVNLNPDAPPELLVSLNEQALLKETEDLETILGTLDGRLSLFNATTAIEV